MRIAFVIPYFYPALEYGGTPRIAYDFAKALAQRGHALKILTTDTGGSTRLESKGTNGTQCRGIEVVHYANISNNLAFRRRIFLPPAFFADVRRQLRDVDIAHIHEFRSFLSVGAHKALQSLEIPFVLSPHGGLQHLGKRRAKIVFDWLWGGKILRDAAIICAVSPAEEEDAADFGITRQRIAHLPSAINTDAFRDLPPRTERHGPKTILFLGRLNWIKSVDVLIRAFHQIRLSIDAKLIIAGPDDGAGTSLRELVRELKSEDAVTFAGFLNDQAKIQAVIDSNLVVLPSSREGFPLTVLETLACRVPMIVSSACKIGDWLSAAGAPESLTTFQTGDSKDLAAKIMNVLTTPISATELERRRNVVMKYFSTHAIAASAEELYLSIIDRTGAAQAQGAPRRPS